MPIFVTMPDGSTLLFEGLNCQDNLAYIYQKVSVKVVRNGFQLKFNNKDLPNNFDKLADYGAKARDVLVMSYPELAYGYGTGTT